MIGNEIEYFARNGTSTGLADVEEAVELAGITYDDTTRTMYLSDVSKKKEGNNMSTFSNASIFILTERTFTSTPLLKSKYRALGLIPAITITRLNSVIVSRIF